MTMIMTICMITFEIYNTFFKMTDLPPKYVEIVTVKFKPIFIILIQPMEIEKYSF